jgi:putative ABC transport system permease protein
MTALLQHELRSIMASFRRRPLVPLTVIGMLALGIAANVAVFTVITRTLLRPLPYRGSERIAMIRSTFVEPDRTEKPYPSGSVEIVQWQRRTSRFSSIEAVRPMWMTVRDGGDPESVAGANVTAGVFRLLGVRPILGRDFVREDDVPESRVAVIRYGFWQRRFGGSEAVVGRSVFLDGRRVSIIGVLPRDFELAAVTPQPDLFVPNGFSPAHMPNPGQRGYAVFGRLRDGVSVAQGQSDLRRISVQLASEHPATHENWTATVQTLRDAAFGDRRKALVVLWLAVLLVHILACVNVASLLSAQIADERGITAVRLSLGASRWHILRYRLIQSLLTTAAGTVAGLLAGSLALRFVLVHETDPALTTPVAGAWALPLFVAALAIVTAVLVAIVPALRETRTSLTSSLNEQGSRASSSVAGARLRELFIIGEVAIAVPLLLAALATVQRFRELQRVDLGFDPKNVLVSQIVMPPRYDKTTRAAFARELVRRIEALPGVASAGVTQCNFQPNGAVTTTLATDRFPEPIAANFRRITPHTLATLRIPLIAGRNFTAADSLDSPPVAIVSAALAKRLFPNENAIGRRILRTPPNPPHTIVGVARDVFDDGAAVPLQPALYVPYLQTNNIYLTLVVRTKGDPLQSRDAVRRAVWSLDQDITPSNEKPLAALTDAAVGSERLQMLLLSAFGLVALALAVVGIYGMTSYSVARRMREIGVRLAFGATPRDVVAEVVRRSARSVAMGLVLGIALAVAAQRVASLVVFGAAEFDQRAAAILVVAFFVTAVVAACVPSLRARHVRPVMLLRDA